MATILTVDDSPSVRQMIKLVLGPAGHDVSEAVDGAEGLAKAKTQRFDLVITDLNMPVMNGVDFLRQLRQEPGGAAPVVVFCTVEADMEHIREALSSGADEYIMKPFDGDVIEAKFIEAGAL